MNSARVEQNNQALDGSPHPCNIEERGTDNDQIVQQRLNNHLPVHELVFPIHIEPTDRWQPK